MIKDSNPIVSVIINCFNGSKFIEKAIESVLAQSYKNLEIIVWDNQSTDNSANIVNSYNDKSKNFSISFLFLTCLHYKEVDKWKVYYLGGQSNMDGYGYNLKLPDSLNIEIKNTMIFDGYR